MGVIPRTAEGTIYPSAYAHAIINGDGMDFMQASQMRQVDISGKLRQPALYTMIMGGPGSYRKFIAKGITNWQSWEKEANPFARIYGKIFTQKNALQGLMLPAGLADSIYDQGHNRMKMLTPVNLHPMHSTQKRQMPDGRLVVDADKTQFDRLLGEIGNCPETGWAMLNGIVMKNPLGRNGNTHVTMDSDRQSVVTMAV